MTGDPAAPGRRPAGRRPAAGLPPAADLVEHALAATGGGERVVIVEDRSEVEVRFANNTTTTNGERRDRRITVVSIVEGSRGTSAGVASRSGTADVDALVEAAEADARSAPPADDGAPLLAGAVDPSFRDGPVLTGFDAVSPVVRGLSDAFARARAEHQVLAGFVTHVSATRWLGTSTGTRLRHVQPTGSVQLVARDRGGRSAWAGRGAEEFAEGALARLDETVAKRLAAARRHHDLPAGRYDVLLPPDAVADLMIVLAEAASGRDAEDGRSVFSRPGGGTRVGDEISAMPFELSSDPSAPGLSCISYLCATSSGTDVSVFDNGAPIARTRWIAGGRLERLRYHRAAAERSGVPFTPPVDNLVLSLPGATASLDDLVAGTETGLLLTCLWYIREVDLATLLLTGLTRDGVYLVEDGEIVGDVNNFRFNESPVDLLSRVAEAGASERALSREWGEWMSRTAMPPLKVTGFNMSSVSPAS